MSNTFSLSNTIYWKLTLKAPGGESYYLLGSLEQCKIRFEEEVKHIRAFAERYPSFNEYLKVLPAESFAEHGSERHEFGSRTFSLS